MIASCHPKPHVSGRGDFDVHTLSTGLRNSGVKNRQMMKLSGRTGCWPGLMILLLLASHFTAFPQQEPVRQSGVAGLVKLRAGKRRGPAPGSGRGEKLLAVFLAPTQGQSIAADGTREITDSIKDSAARLPADLAGANEVIFFISSRTGQQVKRPA